MDFWTRSERDTFKNSVDEKIQTRSREFSQDDFAPQRRSTNTDIGSLVRQLSEAPIRMIDALIAELEHRREAILGENTRMQREIIEYAELHQSTRSATRIMSESLANLAAPAVVEAVSDQGKSASEEVAERDASRLLKARASVPLAPEE